MSIYSQPKPWESASDHSFRHFSSESTAIPSVITVERKRSPRVTSSFLGKEDLSSGGMNNRSSKPWRVDMAKKSYSSRRFRRQSRKASFEPVLPPPSAYSPSTSSFENDDVGSPELDGSWTKKDNGYPSVRNTKKSLRGFHVMP